MRPATLPPSPTTLPPATTRHGPRPADSKDPGDHRQPLRAGPRLPPPIPARRLFQIPDNTAQRDRAPSEAGDSNRQHDHPPPEAGEPGRRPGEYGASCVGSKPSTTPASRRHRPRAPALPDRVAPEGHEPDDRPDAPVRRLGHGRASSRCPAGQPDLSARTPARLPVPDTARAGDRRPAGKNVRYRSFFIVDRTRATGFNPSDPGDFRDCIVYRRADRMIPALPVGETALSDRSLDVRAISIE